ncbi:MAG: O-antigen ligase family protein [Pseudomonadota bacterium]
MGPVAFWVAALVIAAAPLLYGGNRPAALVFLELLSIISLFVIARSDAWRADRLPALLWIVITSPLWIAAIQLIPLPTALWAALPGHGIYAEILRAFGADVGTLRPITLIPAATWYSALAGLPVIAALLTGYFASRRQIEKLSRLVLAIALIQVAVCFVQVATTGATRPLGTFANPNHLASYLCLALCALACSAHLAAVRTGTLSPLAWSICAIALLVGVLLTRSRGAQLFALLPSVAALAIVATYWINMTRRSWLFALAGIAAISVGFVGIEFATARFSAALGDESTQMRVDMAVSSLQGALRFLPFGSGLGTFEAVYAQFQPTTMTGLVNHAHMDYIEFLFEAGLLFVVVAIALAVLMGRKLSALLRAGRGQIITKDSMLSLVCALGLLGFLLHSLVEFNMRIPATAILASFLAGVFLRPSDASRRRASGDSMTPLPSTA